MTPDEIKELCEKLLPLGQKEAHSLLAGYGMNPKNADMLRHLLGTTKPRQDPYDKELVEECRMLVEEKGMSIPAVAKLKGIWSTTVYGWSYRDGWNIVNGHEFWTEMKIRLLVNEVKKGTERKIIAMKLGCSSHMVNSMWYRCVRRCHVRKWEPLLEKLGLKREVK